MIRFVPRERTPVWLTLAVSVGAGMAALLLTAVPLALSGAPVLSAFGLMKAPRAAALPSPRR
ncbi:hypothetical protein J2X65_004034 [Ancylobacter sp. 3268]|nr:hypothetical protein [Ancylobacter sp. 3268]